jgi:hypothetical protein
MGFQSQNYGADFINSMVATAGMFNDRRKLDMEEAKQAREQKTLELQQQGLALENQSKEMAIEGKKKLGEWLNLAARMNSGTLTEQDYEKIPGLSKEVLKAVPYFPNDLAEFPKYQQAAHTLLSAAQQASNLPANNYVVTRDDNMTELNQVFDGLDVLLSKDRLGKEFTDTDGSVTGTPGAKYRTARVWGAHVISGDGNKAAFNALFSVVDENGRPILDASGKQKVVPATVGGSNDPGDRLRLLTTDEIMLKAGFMNQFYDTVNKAGLTDPAKQKQFIASNLRAAMGEKGAEDYLKDVENDSKITSFDPDKDLYQNGQLIRKGARSKKQLAKFEEGVPGRPGWVREMVKYDDGTQDVGEPYPKHAPKGGDAEVGSVPADAKMVNFLVNNGIAKSKKQAWDMLKMSKSDPVGSVARLVSDWTDRQEKAGIDSTNPRYRSPEQMLDQATKLVQDVHGRILGDGQTQSAGLQVGDVTPLRSYFNRNAGSRPMKELIASAQRSGWTDEQIRAAQQTEQQAPKARTTVPSQPAAVRQQPAAAKAVKRGNAVIFQGRSYPLNPDGTVTIGGRKYGVQ